MMILDSGLLFWATLYVKQKSRRKRNGQATKVLISGKSNSKTRRLCYYWFKRECYF